MAERGGAIGRTFPVTLVVAVGSRVPGRITADLCRGDLEVQGYAMGRCGSEPSLPVNPLRPREGREIAVGVEGSGLHLEGSPYALGSAVRVVR